VWDVRDAVWKRYLKRTVPIVSLRRLTGDLYLQVSRQRYRNRVAGIKKAVRTITAKAYHWRNPFVVL
jgi:hypothetical protein